MAGELVEVFGNIRLSLSPGCPKDLLGKKVILKSKDGFISQVPAEAACLSASIRNIIVHSGVEGSIRLPIMKGTMTKVVEYLNYHENKPAGEIKTPLPSDALDECGVLSWDSHFIQVDRVVLFELILAASLLQIQSLFFLAGAKAALMTRNKAETKLRKEFGLLDDLPARELEETQGEYQSMLSKRLRWSEEESEGLAATSLAVSSVLMAGLMEAAANNDILDVDYEGGAYAIDIKSWRHANWRVTVVQSWQALANAPTAITSDRDLLIASILASQGQALRYASAALKRDRQLVLQAIKHRGACFKDAGPELQQDRQFVLQAVLANGAALSYAPVQFRGDRKLLLDAAAHGRGDALEGATVELQRDSSFVLDMVERDLEAYQFAAEGLRMTRDFALAAAKRNGCTLKHMSHIFRADRQIVATAVSADPDAVVYSHTSCRRDLGMSLPWDSDGKTVAEQMQGWGRGPVRERPYTGPTMNLYVEHNQLTVEYQCTKYDYIVNKILQFSASNVMTANMGQSNYIAANSFLDKMPFFERPVKDAITLMWGAVGGIGMRLKAFGSQDFLNYTPEAQTTLEDASMILRVTVAFTGQPEWYNTQMYDPVSRAGFLSLTAGYGTGGGWTPSETAEVSAKTVPLAGAAKEEPVKREDALEVPTSPLAGWPDLSGLPGPAACVRRAAAAQAPTAVAGVPFAENSRVMLVGMKAKNGMMGTLVKRQSNGKWKIKMDGDAGLAYLKEENLAPLGGTRSRLAIPSPAKEANVAPIPAPPKETSKQESREQFHIVGTWNNWAEPEEMTWDRSARCYKFRLRLAYRQESFQILRGGSWDACVHPARETSGRPGTDYVVEGTSERQSCRGLHWTVGNHPEDQGVTGEQYEVRLFVNALAQPKRVSWTRLGGPAAMG